MSTRVADFEIAAELKNQGAAMEVIGMEDLTIKAHCRRCDSEGPRLIRFVTPDNRPYYLCDTCLAQQDKREMRFSPTWKRSRRPSGRPTVAVFSTPA